MSSSAIPSSPPSKRSASPSLERSRPSKRSHTAMNTAPSTPPATTVLTPVDPNASDCNDARTAPISVGMDLEDCVQDTGAESPPAATRKNKGKGRALPQVDLPEQVWTRVFEHYYDEVCEEWNVDNQYHNALTPLLLSKDLLVISMPVFYRHPHVNYRSLPSFGRCIQLPLRYTSGTKLSLVRHLTIRPSHTPAVQTIKSPVRAPSATGLRPYPPTPVYKYTVHPSLHTVCQLFLDLTSFTLKDTLVRHWSDAKLLFGSLKHLRLRKARLEIRMWDLSESLLGRDLVAASSPNVHAEFSSTGAQTSRWRMTQWATHGANWDHQAREMWQGENDRTQMMQRWRDVLLDGGELHLPAWWIEPPQPSPNFAAAAANHQHGLLGLGQANHGGNVYGNNANGNNGNGNQGQTGLPYAMSHLPQAHPPHHTHHRAAFNGAFYPNLQTHVGGRQGGGFANTSTSTTSSHPAGAAVGLTPGSIDGISSALPQSAPVTDMHSSLLGADTGEGMSGSRDVGSGSATGSRMRPIPFLDDDNACMLDQEAFEEMLTEAEAAAASSDWPHDWPSRPSALPHLSRHGDLSSSTSTRARRSAESTSGHPNSAQRPSRLPRGSVLLAARALGRPDPADLINGLTSVGPSPSVPGGTSDHATRQNTQTADALERLRDLRMSQRVELTSRQMDPSASPSLRPDSGQASYPGLGSHTWTHPLWPRDNSGSLPTGARPDDVSHFGGGAPPRRHLAGISNSSRNLAGAVSTRGGGDQEANTTQPTPLPFRSDLPTTSSASVPNVSRGPAAGPSEPTSQGVTDSPISFAASAAVSTTPAQPDRSTLGTQSSFPTTSSAAFNHLPPPAHMADPLRSMRMDHIIPTEEELQQYGNDWYLHHREPTPWATRPILRIDSSSQSSVPGPRAADSAARPAVDPDDDPSLTVTYLGVTGHALAHEMRGMLLDLLENHWSPTIQAFAFQALDPLATLIVRDPRLMFWISLGIPHIRVHLPRGISSLAVFKDPKTCQRDRHRAARRAEQAAAAAAAVEETAGQGEAGTAAPMHPALAHSAVANTNFAPLVGHVPGANGNAATDSTTQQIVEDEEEERVVGGDGSGGELVHDGTRLFEIEVNTLQEMANDEGWYRAGGQLPPQVCRVLAGDRAHDWRDVRVGPRTFSPNYLSGGGTPISPSSSQFLSPTFSFVDLESEEEGRSDRSGSDADVYMEQSGGSDGTPEQREDQQEGRDESVSRGNAAHGVVGERYDFEAAKEQRRVVEERKYEREE